MSILIQDIIIRSAAREDCPAIHDTLVAAFLEFKDKYTEGGYDATVLSPERLAKRLYEGPVWVATHNNGIIATASAVETPHGLYIRGMCVRPDARGAGIGKLFLYRIERFAESLNLRRIYLSTTPYLHTAIAMYEHAGYVRIDDPPHDLHGTPLFQMEKLS